MLIIAGVSLAVLCYLLLRWARASRPVVGSLLPWIFALPIFFVHDLPPELYAAAIQETAPRKYFYSSLWIGGIFIYSAFLLRPLVRDFDPRRLAAGFFACALLLSAAPATQPPNESDEGDYVVAAFALLETGKMRVDRVMDELDDFYFGHIPATWWAYRERLEKGESVARYSFRMIGYPLLLAPFVFLAEITDAPGARWMILYIPSLIGYGLMMLAICKILEPYRARRAGALTMAFALPPLYFATNAQPETWMAAAVAWMIYLLDRRPRGAAIVAMLALLLHERMVIFSIPVILLALTRDGRGVMSAAAIIFPMVLLSYASVRQFVWSAETPHGYARADFVDLSRWLRMFHHQVFSATDGIIPRFPAIVLILAALRKPDFSVLLFLFYLGVIITYPDTTVAHSRYLVPALPLVAGVLASGVERVGRIPIAILLGAQIVIDWYFLTVPMAWRFYWW